jgi:hypothetical protein
MRDIYDINHSLHDKFLMIGEHMRIEGFDISIREMRNKREALLNWGIVKKGVTKINYFSTSARVIITVEISKKTFQFSNRGKLVLIG